MSSLCSYSSLSKKLINISHPFNEISFLQNSRRNLLSNKVQNIHHSLVAQFLLHLGEGMKETLEYTVENQYIFWWSIEKGEVNWTGKKLISKEKDRN